MAVEGALTFGRRFLGQPWWLGVLQAGRWRRAIWPMFWDVGPAERPASLTTTKDTERSGVLAPEAVWKCGDWRALAGPRAGDLRLQTADKDRLRGWADGLRGLGRNGPRE